jgi:hypothetical protein
MALSTKTATSVQDVQNTIGVNTHLEMQGFGYQNLTTTAAAINYLGINNLRDSANTTADLGSTGIWQKIANATGAKFDVYLVRGSTSADIRGLSYAKTLAGQGIVNLIEGVDEADLAGSYGNSLSWAANYQKTVYATAHSLGIKVVNMSFGAGWTWLNNWEGNYASQGNLSAYADYANAHTYPSAGQTVESQVIRLNSLAKMAASSRPVITTEIGWNGSQYSQAAAAKYTLDAVFDGVKNGDVKTYFYSLFDDKSGTYGLMNADGSAKPAGKALHNLSVIMADTGAARHDSLTYGLTGTTSNDHSILMEKSNGTFQLAVWDEVSPAHSVTLSLASAASSIKVYDPLSSSTAIQTYTGKSSISFTVPDHPVIVEISNSGTSQSTPETPPPTTTSKTYSVGSNQTLNISGGTNAITVSGSYSRVVATGGTNTYTVKGIHDVITGGSGKDVITSTAGYNTLNSGAGADTITFSGSHNVVYAGAGDTLTDSGSYNRIVFGAPTGTPTQIKGLVLKNGDVLDLRTTLAGTKWTGSSTTLSKFLKVGLASNGTDAVISIDPTGVAGAATYQLAVLHNSGSVSLSTLLAHSLTA